MSFSKTVIAISQAMKSSNQQDSIDMIIDLIESVARA